MIPVGLRRCESVLTRTETGATTNQHLVTRAAWLIALVTLWCAGYFGVGNSAATQHARDLITPLDRAIPFLGWSVWVYLLGIPMAVIPVFVLPSLEHFERTAQAYAVVIVASLACFMAFPLTVAHLRASNLPSEPLTRLVLQTLYAIDPPCNLFPSLHVSLCALAAVSMAEARPRSRWVWYSAFILIAMSVSTVKQHLALDVFGGLVVALLARRIVAVLHHREPPLRSLSLLFRRN